MPEILYSIRMRSSNGDTHISGAERIVGAGSVDKAVFELLERANTHGRGIPDNISISIDSLEDRNIRLLPPLPVRSLNADGFAEGRLMALDELEKAGVSSAAAVSAMAVITSGTVLGGATIINSLTGERLGADKGIRARAVDYDLEASLALNRALELAGLTGTRLRDALALATKVAGAPGAVAELCISDNPEYVTGYVASPQNGYVRITPMKQNGDFVGGRIFFVDGGKFEHTAYSGYLRETPVLVSGDVRID